MGFPIKQISKYFEQYIKQIKSSQTLFIVGISTIWVVENNKVTYALKSYLTDIWIKLEILHKQSISQVKTYSTSQNMEKL